MPISDDRQRASGFVSHPFTGKRGAGRGNGGVGRPSRLRHQRCFRLLSSTSRD